MQHTDEKLRQIIEGCVVNDRRSQEALYRMYFNKMYGMCMKYTADQDKAMEIVNNGFLKVFKNIGSFGFQGSFEGWVRRCVFHSLSDYFRLKRNRVKFIELSPAESTNSHFDSPLQQLYVEDVMQLVDKLPENSRRVFEMFALEGCAHKEIAEQLNISEGTSKWHLSNARKILRSYLKNQNIISSYAG